jgi:DNA-binding IscR family transcriptional regulator
MELDRRDHSRRAAIARGVVDLIVQRPETVVTIERLCDSFQIPADAARRILASLVRAGVVAEIREGIWMNPRR